LLFANFHEKINWNLMNWIFLKSVTRMKILMFVLGWPERKFQLFLRVFWIYEKSLEIYTEIFPTYFQKFSAHFICNLKSKISGKKNNFFAKTERPKATMKSFHPQEKSLIYSINDPKLCNKKYHSISNLFYLST
jgi:hypothetical protein